jgi:hypothetical protein
MSEPRTPRVVDPAPRSAPIARAFARPRPGLATAVVCAVALAAGAIHGAFGPHARPAGSGGPPAATDVRAVQVAPGPAGTPVALRR